jgi:hypothetical protein
MAHQGTFTATTAAHDNKNITAVYGKREVPLDNKASVSHGEVFDGDMSLLGFFIFRHN